jgi:uncharacterized protein (DUF2164 family)
MRHAQHTSNVVVDEETRRRVTRLVARVGVARAMDRIGVSFHTFQALREHGAMRRAKLEEIKRRLDAIEREEDRVVVPGLTGGER